MLTTVICDQIDLKNVEQLKLCIRLMEKGKIEIRLDKLDGPVINSVPISASDGGQDTRACGFSSTPFLVIGCNKRVERLVKSITDGNIA